MKLFILIIALNLSFYGSAQTKLTRTQKKELAFLEKAAKAYRNKDFTEANNWMDIALSKDLIKDEYPFYVFKGNIEFALQNLPAARTAYLKSLQLANNSDADLSAIYIGLDRVNSRIEKDSTSEIVESYALLKAKEASKFNISEKNPENDLPFSVIEKIPVYPGCESSTTNAQLKSCLQQSIAQFIVSNFRTDLASATGLTGKVNLLMNIKVNKEGTVEIIKAQSIHPLLEFEAIRVVKLLPQLTPGTQKGVPVNVIYGLPIIFELQ
ncbi:energy transducer TonB [Nonlabens antarcticus]|uniref:energy transducer TonB n=1 Tax=Nonlabens antarcticus TaxID=392714 RepID=UPI001891B260|nr:energy transducer TonB [Nonlabens antarcticus]